MADISARIDPLIREALQRLEDDQDTLVARVAANQADSTAEDVAGLVTDFNALLAKLIAAGLMESE